ncbi:MAG TPA: triose-phosphate isomerase [Gemmatimonadales bacterium]|nr:triose-phosphate isomerase [Gemmatimonadales bacterium]
MRRLLFAANWKMHLGPADAQAYMDVFLRSFQPAPDRDVWFFPPAVSLATVAARLNGRNDLLAGAQDVHWEPKGAFTGAISVPLAAQAGARAALIGHSERRHVFGESDADTARKVRAVQEGGLVPVLCVGEKLAERESGATLAVVQRQLAAALDGQDGTRLDRIVIAYEPVWAIGTGRNATPQDAAAVHREIRRWLGQRGAKAARILYGGSVNLKNIAELVAEPELDGVLVGGASLDPVGWTQLVSVAAS